MNQRFSSENITYNACYFFDLLLHNIIDLFCCGNTGWYNIESIILILHERKWILRSDSPEHWKNLHIMSTIFTYLFIKPNNFKSSKGSNIIFCNIPCNLLYIELKIPQWKYSIQCMILLPPPTPSYQWVVILWKDNVR